MKRYLMLLTALLAASAAAQTVPVRPENFAQQARLELNGAGPFYQLPLSVAVYQGVQRGDLGDLRVFNGQGEVVPHALLRPQTTAVAQLQETVVPVFPILGTTENRGEFSLEVQRRSDGTLIALRQGAPSKSGIVRGAVLDASRLAGARRSLRLNFGPAATPFHVFALESSDDLQQWRLLKGNAQLVRLEQEGQRIEHNTVEWNVDAGKYLRILWADPSSAPSIVAAAVGSFHTDVERPALIWSEPVAPTATNNANKDSYDYRLPGYLPLEQLKISLPQSNTLAPVAIQHLVFDHGRRREQTLWQNLTQAVIYRLNSPEGEIRSPPIVLNSHSESQLRLAFDARGGGIGNVPPTLQIGFVPQQLVFLARGDGPFVLAWGAAKIENAALSVTTLVPGYGADRKLAASPASLLASTLVPSGVATAAAATASEIPKETRKALLWSVLIVGVLVLAGMAWALVRQMKPGATPK